MHNTSILYFNHVVNAGVKLNVLSLPYLMLNDNMRVYIFPKSSLIIRWIIVFGMSFNSSTNLQPAFRCSFKTAETWAMFSSIFVVLGLPHLCSSSNYSLPDKNYLCHQNTVARDITNSPYIWSNHKFWSSFGTFL
jgi:hypothetical protein